MKKSVIKVLLILGLFGFMTFPISPTIAAPEQLSSIKIGVFVPDTNNQLSVYAPWTRQGFELGMIYATNNTNQTAGGVPYEILYYDTQGNAATVATQVISAIETDGVDILVGGTWSSVAGAIAPIAKERQKLFFITPAASSALTGSLFNEYSFRVARNSWHDAKAGIKYAFDTVGARNFAFIAPGYSFGYSGVSTMTSEILERGGTVVTTEYVPLGTTDLTPYMDHLLDVDASLGIDMLMVIWAGSFNDLYRDMTLKNIGSFMNVSGGVIDILSMTASELGLTTGTLINSTGLAVYGYELPNNPVNDWMVAEHVTRNIKPNGALGLNYRVPELFTASGFGTAQFMVNVTSEVPDLNVTNMICQLEGLNITTPKGPTYMRPEDHQGLAEMYIAKAVNDTRSGSETENQIIGELVETIPAMDVAPPIETDYVPCAGPSNQVTTTQTGTVTDTKVNTQTETDTVTVTPGFVSPYIILGLGLVAVALVNKNRRK